MIRYGLTVGGVLFLLLGVSLGLREFAPIHYNRIITTVLPVKGVFYGNSIVYEGGDWSERLGGTRVRNAGFPGVRLVYLLEHLDAEVLSYEPSFCIVMAGINDFLHAAEPEAVLSPYSQLIATLEAESIQPIIVSTLHVRGDLEVNRRVKAFNMELKQMALQRRCFFIDANAELAPNGELIGEYTRDDIHLNAVSYSILGDLIAQELRQIDL